MNLPNELFESLCQEKAILKAVLSHPEKGVPLLRVTLRPLLIKGQECVQAAEEFPSKIHHKNLTWGEVPDLLRYWLKDSFREAHLFTQTAEFHLLKNKKGDWKIVKKLATRLPVIEPHNRTKRYLIDPSSPFWQKLGVAGKNGEIKPSMHSKFRQVERFLEIANDLLKKLPQSQNLRVIDFGCGKSYLTFALAELLKNQGQAFEILGIDLKEEVVKNLNRIANDLEYTHLKFIAGSIQDFEIEGNIDLVISLHACDTATDALLAKAIQSEAKGILSVPCCQHELFSQIEQPLLAPLLKYGILKERFSALVTDACRAGLLEQYGYQTQILEFIDTEHTPKNLLIRAIKKDKNRSTSNDLSTFFSFLHVNPQLNKLLKDDHSQR